MQRDLFHIPTPSDTIASLHASRGGMLEKFRISLRLDHIIVLFLGMIFLYALIYSFGVEKGKKTASQNIEVLQEKIKQAIITETVQKETAMIDATKLPVPAAAIAAAPAVKNTLEAPRAEVREAAASAVPAAPLKTVEVQPPVKAAETKAVKGKYTVQIVTFNSKDQADAQIKKLASQGYNAFVVPSGKLFQICVNGFEKRQDAAASLKELKAKGIAPADAYVRNMPA